MLISIVIPVYNVEKFLSACLDSIISQNIADTEIIIINDGSTDNSLEVIMQYLKKCNRIRLINQIRNKGLGHARNIGIKASKGEYILFVDSDDWLKFGALATLKEKVSHRNYDLITFGFKRFQLGFNNWGTKKTKEYLPNLKEDSCDYFIDALLCINGLSPMVWHYLFSAEFLRKNKMLFSEEIYFEDVPFTIEALFYCNNFGVIEQSLYNYREHKSSITYSKSKKKIEDSFTSHFMIKEFLEKNNIFNKYKNEYIVRLLSFCVAPCFLDYLKLPKNEKDIELRTFMSQALESNLLSHSNLALLEHTAMKIEKTNPKHQNLSLKRAYYFLIVIRSRFELLNVCFQIGYFIRRLFTHPTHINPRS